MNTARFRPRKSDPNPPAHLGDLTLKWWLDVVAGYELEDHHIRLLTLAAESWDRNVEARETLAREGCFYMNRFGEPRAHPAVAVERDSKISFARLIRELDLDVEPPRDPSRPPGLGRRA
jgi:phage terminase small subunit